MDPRQQIIEAMMSSRAPNVTERAKSPMTVDMGAAMGILSKIDPWAWRRDSGMVIDHDYVGQDQGSSSLALPNGRPTPMPYTAPLKYGLNIRNGG